MMTSEERWFIVKQARDQQFDKEIKLQLNITKKDKADNLTIKKLTYNNPTMKEKFDAVKDNQ